MKDPVQVKSPRQFAQVKASGLVCVHFAQSVTGTRQAEVLQDAQQAWQTLDHFDHYQLFRQADTYLIGHIGHFPYLLLPEGHPRLTEIRAEITAREARQAEWQAERWRVVVLAEGRGVIVDEAGEAQEITRQGHYPTPFHALRYGLMLPLDALAHARKAGHRVTPYGGPAVTQPESADVPAVRIEVSFSESPAFAEDGQVFSGPDCWAQFEAVRAEVIRQAREHHGWIGGYDKTDVEVIWADGTRYATRYDIGEATEDFTLEYHLLRQLRFDAGLYHPPHLSAEQYAHVMQEQGGQTEASAFLSRYRIGSGELPRPWEQPTPTHRGQAA